MNEKRIVYLMLFATLVVVGLAVFVLLGRTIAYEPMTIVDIVPEPLQSCPGDEIKVDYIYRYNAGLYTIDRVEGDTYFIGAPDESGQEQLPIGGNHYNEDLDNKWITEDVEDFQKSGPTRRQAPFAGVWYPSVDTTVYGRLFGIIPVKQEIVLNDDTAVDVREYSDPECVAERLVVETEDAEELQEELKRLAEEDEDE